MDSLCCTTETNTTLKAIILQLKLILKRWVTQATSSVFIASVTNMRIKGKLVNPPLTRLHKQVINDL